MLKLWNWIKSIFTKKQNEGDVIRESIKELPPLQTYPPKENSGEVVTKPVVTPKPVPITDRPKGFDVAKFQPTMDATEWKKSWDLGYRYTFAKASDGETGKDPLYATHRKLSKAQGFLFGSYHFLRLMQDPVAQAENFMKATGGIQVGELPMTVDVEWDNSVSGKARYGDGKQMDQRASDVAYRCLEIVEKLSGMTPIIYTHPYFFIGFKNPERFARFIPWITRPGKVEPVVPLPWKDWVFWQNSFTFSIGDVKEIDTNFFRGSLDELKAMVKQ